MTTRTRSTTLTRTTKSIAPRMRREEMIAKIPELISKLNRLEAGLGDRIAAESPHDGARYWALRNEVVQRVLGEPCQVSIPPRATPAASAPIPTPAPGAPKPYVMDDTTLSKLFHSVYNRTPATRDVMVRHLASDGITLPGLEQELTAATAKLGTIKEATGIQRTLQASRREAAAAFLKTIKK